MTIRKSAVGMSFGSWSGTRQASILSPPWKKCCFIRCNSQSNHCNKHRLCLRHCHHHHHHIIQAQEQAVATSANDDGSTSTAPAPAAPAPAPAHPHQHHQHHQQQQHLLPLLQRRLVSDHYDDYDYYYCNGGDDDYCCYCYRDSRME